MSRKSSGLSASGLSMEKAWIFPVPSATIIRLVSGSWAMQTGLWNLSRSKTRLSRYGRGRLGRADDLRGRPGDALREPEGPGRRDGSSPPAADRCHRLDHDDQSG